MPVRQKKKQQITLRRIIGGSLSFLFILTLWGAVRWANYRQTFTIDNIRFTGLEILEKEMDNNFFNYYDAFNPKV